MCSSVYHTIYIRLQAPQLFDETPSWLVENAYISLALGQLGQRYLESRVSILNAFVSCRFFIYGYMIISIYAYAGKFINWMYVFMHIYVITYMCSSVYHTIYIYDYKHRSSSTTHPVGSWRMPWQVFFLASDTSTPGFRFWKHLFHAGFAFMAIC